MLSTSGRPTSDALEKQAIDAGYVSLLVSQPSQLGRRTESTIYMATADGGATGLMYFRSLRPAWAACRIRTY